MAEPPCACVSLQVGLQLSQCLLCNWNRCVGVTGRNKRQSDQQPHKQASTQFDASQHTISNPKHNPAAYSSNEDCDRQNGSSSDLLRGSPRGRGEDDADLWDSAGGLGSFLSAAACPKRPGRDPSPCVCGLCFVFVLFFFLWARVEWLLVARWKATGRTTCRVCRASVWLQHTFNLDHSIPPFGAESVFVSVFQTLSCQVHLVSMVRWESLLGEL